MKLAIILFLFFLSFSSYAEINGKGLICKCKKLTNNPKCEKPFFAVGQFINPITNLGVFFDKGKAQLFYIGESKVNNKVISKIAKDKNYFVFTESPNSIYWPQIEVATNPKIWGNNYSGSSIFTWSRGIFEINRKTLILIKTDLENNNNEWVYDCNSTNNFKNPQKNFKSFIFQMNKLVKIENQKLKNLEKGNKF